MTAAFLERLGEVEAPAGPFGKASEFTSYVIVYATPKDSKSDEVLLIEKKRPAWQKGRFNLPGGHIEFGETIHAAACRELQEETGLECDEADAKIMGSINGADFVVYIVRCEYEPGQKLQQLTDERVFFMSLDDLYRDPRVIGNLRVIVPLCKCGLAGWILSDNSDIYRIVIADAAA
jgi:8-oxo-dGTP diphosphatase